MQIQMGFPADVIFALKLFSPKLHQFKKMQNPP